MPVKRGETEAAANGRMESSPVVAMAVRFTFWIGLFWERGVSISLDVMPGLDPGVYFNRNFQRSRSSQPLQRSALI